MSLCVYMQQVDQIIIGADTAITRTGNDGQKYRDSRGIDKLVQVGKYLIFACGDLAAVSDVISSFRSTRTPTMYSLQQIIRRRYRQLCAEKTARVVSASKKGESLLNIVCFEIESNGRTVSHVFNSINNFKHERKVGIANHTHLVTGGYQSERAFEIAIASNAAGVTNPEILIRRVFESLAGTDIGGELTLYVMDKYGIKLLSRERINETIQYPIVDIEDLLLESGRLVGGTITGALLRTSASGARVEIDASGWRSIDENGRERISISRSAQGMNAIAFSGTSGYAGYINGQSGLISLVSTGDLLLASVTGTTHMQGTLNFSSVPRIIGLDANKIGGLSDLLAGKVNKGDPTTSYTGGGHNHGIPDGTVLRTADGGTVTYRSYGGFSHSHSV